MLLCRFCPFMICLNGGARGLSLMYSSFLFNSFNHIPIPFDTDSKADKPPAEWQFFFSAFSSYSFFFLFLAFLLLSPSLFLSTSTFLPSSLSYFPSLPFDPPPIPILVRTYCSAGAQRNPGAPVGFPDKLHVGACALTHTRKADVTGDICCVMPWYGTVRAGIRPVRIMSWVFFVVSVLRSFWLLILVRQLSQDPFVWVCS